MSILTRRRFGMLPAVLLAAALLLPCPVRAQAVAETDAAAVAGPEAPAAQPAAETPPAETPEIPEDPQLVALKQQLERLQTQAQVREQQLQDELAAVKADNQRLQAAAELADTQQQAKLQPIVQEKNRLEAQSAVDKLKQEIDQAPVNAQLQTLGQQQQLREAQLAAALADMKAKTERLTAQTALATAQHAAELTKVQHEQELAAAANQLQAEKLRTQSLAIQAAQLDAQAQLAITQAQVQQREAHQQLLDQVNEDVTYRKDPFVDGVLYISDRRITLDGPIISGVADYVCDRIDYFNNQSDAPIFIIIDNCPGGSVMEGYRIVKAMQSSKAPVHVVVKSFAASMAAIITTLAPHSYAYPNAIILHHQMSAGTWGNMTDLEQEIQTLKEWERRLAEPVAKKMGITVEQFKQKMYDAKKSGDWDEFADQAVKLKWVDHIVTELRDESFRKKPTGEMPKPWWWFYFSKDEHGQTYVNLPPPAPMDAYMLYNPNHFYRVDGTMTR